MARRSMVASAAAACAAAAASAAAASARPFAFSTPRRAEAPLPDWLVTNITTFPTFTKNPDGVTWTLTNGLISRTFTFTPGFGTVDLYSHVADASLLRAIDSEGYITLDATTYALGGIIQTGTEYHAYLNRSADGAWARHETSGGVPMALIGYAPFTRPSATRHTARKRRPTVPNAESPRRRPHPSPH
jgi:hypothetical protein